MHDDSPRSRRDGRDDDHADSAFDALGLSALFGDATQENPVVADGNTPAPTAAPVTPAKPAFADTIPSQPTAEPAPLWPAELPSSQPPVATTPTETPTSFSWFESTPDPVPATQADPAPTAIFPGVTPAEPVVDTPTVAFDSMGSDAVGADAARTDGASAFVAPSIFAADAAFRTDPAPAADTASDAGPFSATTPSPASDPIPAANSFPDAAPVSARGSASAADATEVLGLSGTSASGADAFGNGAGRSGSGGNGSGGSGSGGSGSGGGSRGGSDGPLAGILMFIRQHPRAWLVAAIAAGVVVLSGISFGIGAASASPAEAQALAAATTSAKPTATPTPTPTMRPTASPAAAPSKLRTCSVDSYASNSGFGTLEAQVMNASTGEVLYDRNGSNPAPAASVQKMLVAAAAFSVLGPDYRVPTTVVKGSQPGQVVIVGGGDVTLSGLPTGQDPFYTGAPHLDALAAQVKQAWAADPANGGQPITSVVVDTSLFSGPVWLPSWDENEERVVEGSTPYMTALMVDGDRADPTAVESPRSTDPVGRAAQDFVNDLGGNISVSQGTAPAGAQQLGQVLSQPVSALAEQALTYSDNTIMEELARLVAIKTGAGNSFAAINAGVLKGLQTYGIDETGLYFADGSGLSADNKVPASYLTRFLVKVVDRQGSLGAIYDGMPVAGQTGTLGPGYGRFDGSFSSQADGQVNAKTGWINTARTLAGVIHAKDGTTLTFAVYALNFPGDDAALSAIDDLTTAFYLCGNNLSNN
ncbi:hypothetical protein GCM10027568_00610 [Humibacter soli]